MGKEGESLDLRVAIGELTVKGTVPAGSVLQVTNKQPTPQGNWLELKVCSIPEIVRSNSPNPSQIKIFLQFQNLHLIHLALWQLPRFPP